MDTENKYYKWLEPTLIVQKGIRNKTSYLLYNEISNFKVGNDKFKIVHIKVTNDDSIFTTYKSDYRTEYIKYLKNLYPESYSNEGGFSAAVDAINLVNENLVLLYKNFVLMGAISYDIIDKKRNIEISHIGVLERKKGYGSILINEIFSIAKILKYTVYATSNGYADDFYHSFGMIRLVGKPLGIYMIKSDYIQSFDRSACILHQSKEIQ